MTPLSFCTNAALLLLALLFLNVDSFIQPISRLGSTTALSQSNKASTTGYTGSPRPLPQMIPVPFDIFEKDEENAPSQYDEYEGLFDGPNQIFGLSESAVATTAPVMSFEREFDAKSSSLLELVFESPYDSPAAVRAKNVLRSIILLFLLLGTTFTASYYVFPGSFQHYTVIGQFHPRYTTSLPSLIPFEQAEYSESGGVVWGDNDEFLPKTTVTINDGYIVSTQEPYEMRLLPLEDL
jgi:hypothetical protein